tara:strand:+ start:701 stop:1483 length:783 start_codon:yes stop_codon:yes gene_type:complete
MIILTGHKGFVGRNFLKNLEGEVIKVDKELIDWLVDEFDQWDKVDMVIHQGAISSTVETDLNKIHRYNVDLTVKLFQKCIEYGIPVKYASSASVYGNSTERNINPLNYYALSKVQIDYWVEDHIKDFSLIQGFRYFNVYGDGEDDKGDQASPVSKFTKQVKETGKIKLFTGSKNFYRDFICVDDLVDIVLNNTKESGIYDLGTSEPVSFWHVADCVKRKYNGDIDWIEFPKHLKGKYQGYTKAFEEWDDYKFITVEDYLK